MTKAKPNCPSCSDDSHVRTLGGGSSGQYRYICEECDTRWQQVPPHRKELEEVGKDEQISVTLSKMNRKRSINYKCGKCGAQKRGHVCTSKNTEEAAMQKISNSLLQMSTFKPPSNALLQGDEISVPFSGFKDITQFDEVDINNISDLVR